MRLSFFAVAALCATTLAAHADTYTLLFTPNSAGQAAPTGSFNYDGSTFSNFVINFSGQAFDFTAQANQGFTAPPRSQCQFQTTFQFLSQTGGCTPLYFTFPSASATGNPADELELNDPSTSNGGAGQVSNTVALIDLPPTAGFASTSGRISLTPASTAATPEPSSLALLGTGLLGTLGAARKRFAR